MAVTPAVMLAAALLEDDEMGPTVLGGDLADHGGAGHEGRADVDGAAIGDHQNVGELNLVARVALKLLDLDLLVGRNAILLAARLDDCVHFFCPFYTAPFGGTGDP